MGRDGRHYSSGFPHHQQGASYHIPGPSGRYQGSAQQESRTNQPEARSHDGRNLGSHGGARFHPYHVYQQATPTNAYTNFGNTYPTPPNARRNELNLPNQHMYQDTRPNAVRNYGPAYPTPPFVGNTYPTTPVVGNNTSPYAANASNLNAYPWPPEKARPTGTAPQAQPSPRKERHPPVSAVKDEVEDEGGSSEGEEDAEADEEEHVVMTKGGKKSKQASKARKEVRKGITRVNANGELEWLATASSEGGNVFFIRFHLC